MTHFVLVRNSDPSSKNTLHIAPLRDLYTVYVIIYTVETTHTQQSLILDSVIRCPRHARGCKAPHC